MASWGEPGHSEESLSRISTKYYSARNEFCFEQGDCHDPRYEGRKYKRFLGQSAQAAWNRHSGTQGSRRPLLSTCHGGPHPAWHREAGPHHHLPTVNGQQIWTARICSRLGQAGLGEAVWRSPQLCFNRTAAPAFRALHPVTRAHPGKTRRSKGVREVLTAWR